MSLPPNNKASRTYRGVINARCFRWQHMRRYRERDAVGVDVKRVDGVLKWCGVCPDCGDLIDISPPHAGANTMDIISKRNKRRKAREGKL